MPAVEQYDDDGGRMCYRFTLPGAPRTKKTSNRIVRAGRGGRPRILPSEAFTAWQVACTNHTYRHKVLVLMLEKPVNCAAAFYRDRLNGDAVGYYQGLADVLQHIGVVYDDKLITRWDGSRLLKDAANPRTVVTLTVLNDDR